MKWYECFQETIPAKQKQIIKILNELRSYMFGDGNKLKSLDTVTLLCVIVDIQVCIFNVVVKLNILFLLSKDAMKRIGTCLNLENNNVTMLGSSNEMYFLRSLSFPLYQTKVVKSNIFYQRNFNKKYRLKLQPNYRDNSIIWVVKSYVISLGKH